MSAITDAFLDARIAATKTEIEQIEAAVSALATGDRYATYTIRTASTEEVISKARLPELQSALEAAYNRLATLDARRNGAGAYGRPGW